MSDGAQTQGWSVLGDFSADSARTAAATTANTPKENIPMPQRQFRGPVPLTHLLEPSGRYRRGPLRGAVGAQNTCSRPDPTGPRGQPPPYGSGETIEWKK